MGNSNRNHGHATIKDKPVPVILTFGTLVKIIASVIGPFLLIVSAALYWYHKTNLHMDDVVIHLGQNERGTLETKPEAKVARKAMVKEIKRHVGLKIKEINVEQKTCFQKFTAEMRADQRAQRSDLIREVRRAARYR